MRAAETEKASVFRLSRVLFRRRQVVKAEPDARSWRRLFVLSGVLISRVRNRRRSACYELHHQGFLVKPESEIPFLRAPMDRLAVRRSKDRSQDRLDRCFECAHPSVVALATDPFRGRFGVARLRSRAIRTGLTKDRTLREDQTRDPK